MSGFVYLVGAGPGDPGLITRRGLELLRRADVVLHDRLVAPELLDEPRAEAVLIDVGKTPGRAHGGQDQINRLLVEHARAGRLVVRLKGGDPLVFGRGAEERSACLEAAVSCEAVPGVTSALAAPAAAGIAVTERGVAGSVAVCTPRSPDGVDQRRLRRVAGADTIVVMMGRAMLAEVAATLIDAGRDEAAPAALIERGTMSGQRSVHGRLDEIAQRADEIGLEAPAVLVVGEVTRRGNPMASSMASSMARPMAGRTIVITRPREAGRDLALELRRLGAEVVECPLLRIRLRVQGDPIRAPRARLDACQAIAFTSKHGVRGFAAWLARAGLDARALHGTIIAAVGPATAVALASIGIRADLVPSRHRATELARELIRVAGPDRRPVLFPCGTRALDVLPRDLSAAGIATDRLVVYETLDRPPDAATRRRITEGVDAVVFHAPSAVRCFARSGLEAGPAAVVCIGPTTAAAAREVGLRPRVAAVHSDAGILSLLYSVLDPC